jgi:hypothetical protein
MLFHNPFRNQSIVIPAKAGIQLKNLDPGLRRGDGVYLLLF